jgi:hypothetical protein
MTAESAFDMLAVSFLSAKCNLSGSRWLVLLFAPLMVATSILSGCQLHVDPKTAGATAAAAATGENYQVAVKDKVPLYAAGPGQFTPPDQILNKDDVVWVVKKQVGFTLVQTPEGQVGWVPAEDLSIAPPETPISAGPDYEAPPFLATSHASHSGFVKQRSIDSTRRNSAIVEQYTIPSSDVAGESTPSPSPSP